MGSESPDRTQQKVKEFMSLLPLTLAIAGLPDADSGTHLTEGQLEARATSIKHAYKIARHLVIDIVK